MPVPKRASAVGAAVFAIGVFSPVAAGAQGAGADLDLYYRYPVSVGGQFLSLAAMGEYRSDFDLYDLSAVLRYPLPSRPSLQPILQGGVIQFAPRGDDRSWEHRDLYGLLGVSFSSRLSKTFELGAELAAGASLSLYASLFPETGTVGNYNFLAQAGGRLALIPSYNFAIEIGPSLKYLRSLGELKDFDGLILGVGLSAHVRMGEDPDAAKTGLRSLRFGEAGGFSIFPAMQSWYAKNPFATIAIANAESFPVRDIELTFFQKDYMDSPTLCARVPELGPGETVELGLLASFNAEVFRNEGVTPLSGELTVSYTCRGRPGEQKLSVSFDLQDKSAIVWDDDRKAASFVTPADGALRNYASYIRQINKDELVPGYADTVQFACQTFYALSEIGLLYQSDPAQPYAAARGGKLTVDSVSLPRQTLTRSTGDCDDLAVLYATLLESAGVETALVTVPGHIFVAFNAGTPSRAYGDLHPDRSMTIIAGDELWVPVEVTLIGRSTFLEAWRAGARAWEASAGDPAARGFYPIRRAQELFRPVGLRETDLGLQYGRKEPVVANARRDVGKLAEGVLEAATKAAAASGSKEDLNRLGVRLARFGRYEKAASAFKQASALDQGYLSPRINLGNVYFLSGDHAKAISEYQRVAKLISGDGPSPALANLWLSVSKCYNAMGDYGQAAEFLSKAAAITPSFAERFSYLAASEGSGNRAAAVDVGPVFEE